MHVRENAIRVDTNVMPLIVHRSPRIRFALIRLAAKRARIRARKIIAPHVSVLQIARMPCEAAAYLKPAALLDALRLI